MKLHSLPKIKGSTHRHKILGRGRGTGHGKTSGRGHKGMKARSGGGHRPGFEGGQMPLYRRLPKRGFNNINRIDYAVVNVCDIQELEGKIFGLEELKAAGVLRSNAPILKVLGTGDLSRAVTVKAHRFSDSAKAKILAAGGKVILIEEKKATGVAE
ncbi:MAG: 50S ribosomal protein L15 [Verrucomicrobia bacterium]|jgi:large subunit ribosomal protein L15|nr:50S ribosomal protein L15 [Verrucomicrobiota bacterium]NBS03730.1 50S ribosomal protein L15 [Verrucomicrobiota bacterium]NBY37169.1 50S ribosomal protein L15 [Verrucomicrobiota bacterium]